MGGEGSERPVPWLAFSVEAPPPDWPFPQDKLLLDSVFAKLTKITANIEPAISVQFPLLIDYHFKLHAPDLSLSQYLMF